MILANFLIGDNTRRSSAGCQFLAQKTHPHTPLAKGCKALLERRRQGM
jgi:hypothetical protein